MHARTALLVTASMSIFALVFIARALDHHSPHVSRLASLAGAVVFCCFATVFFKAWRSARRSLI